MTTMFADSRPDGFPRPAHRTGGFTLVEVMVSAALGSFLLLALLTTFNMIGRSGTTLYNYVDMEDSARKGLEKFSEDVRMASGCTWTSSSKVTLTVPHVAADTYANTIVYLWDTTSGSSTYHYFLRQETDTSSLGVVSLTTTTTTLIKNVSSFQFNRWTAGGATGVQATADSNTDQLQIHLTISEQQNIYGVASTAVANATNLVVSARYILRNKLAK
jgi:Tfp pilus assembly protein PilW